MTTKLSGPMLAPANGEAPDSAVVLLHGYGSNGDDLISLAPYWKQVLPGALFVSPNAPQALGMGGYQWFSIDWTGDRLASRQTGVIAARPVLVDFLIDLWTQTGLTPDRTVLAGFYSYGEISPFTPDARCELHNQTMTITTLTER